MKTLTIIALAATAAFAQPFVVEKARGDVRAQRGASEEWIDVRVGRELGEDALVETGSDAFLQLNRAGSRFALESNSALSLDYVREMSINDLLLVLAMEEIREAPDREGNNATGSTAVYGEEESESAFEETTNVGFGVKRLNGAKRLAESGFRESAVAAAKETYRKYPGVRALADYRLYFAEVLLDLDLFEEALEEYDEIGDFPLNEERRARTARGRRASARAIGDRVVDCD